MKVKVVTKKKIAPNYPKFKDIEEGQAFRLQEYPEDDNIWIKIIQGCTSKYVALLTKTWCTAEPDPNRTVYPVECTLIEGVQHDDHRND